MLQPVTRNQVKVKHTVTITFKNNRFHWVACKGDQLLGCDVNRTERSARTAAEKTFSGPYELIRRGY